MSEAGTKTTPNGDKLSAVGKVSGLTIYPMKSIGWIDVDTIHCTDIGCQIPDTEIYDRYFMAVKKNGNPATLLDYSKMVLIKPSCTDGKLKLDAPGMPTLTIPAKIEKTEASILHKSTVMGQETCGIDCGAEAGEWISTFLGKEGIKLAYLDLNEVKRPAKDGLFGAVKVSVPEDLQLSYNNSAPYMLLSEASVEHLNTQLKQPVSIYNFRPNIVVTGCETHLEDTFDVIQIGSTIFRHITHNPRCPKITVDVETGVRHPKMEPMKTLRTYRPIAKHKDNNAPMMGIYMIMEQEGEIKVGDTVYASTKTPVFR